MSGFHVRQYPPTRAPGLVRAFAHASNDLEFRDHGLGMGVGDNDHATYLFRVLAWAWSESSEDLKFEIARAWMPPNSSSSFRMRAVAVHTHDFFVFFGSILRVNVVIAHNASRVTV